jgi:hypothetical protein
MKKIIAFAGMLVLALSVNGFAFSVIGDSNAEKVQPFATIYVLDDGSLAPFGYEKVTYAIDTEERAKRLYMKAFGTMDNYSFDVAKSIVSYIPAGSRPDCDCTPSGLCLRAVLKNGTWDCENSCSPTCLPQLACSK